MTEGMDAKITKYLNKKDPIDNAILELIKEDKLKIDFIEINDGNKKYIKEYSKNILPSKVKHTS